MKLILSIALLLFAATASQAREWTRFRGPNGSGLSEAKTIPTLWTDADINWKVALPGVGHSSPVVWGEQVFVTSFEEATGKFLVLSVDARTGTMLWQKDYALTVSPTHKFNTLASSTPVVDASGIYVCRAEPTRLSVCALDHSGKELWDRDLGTFKTQHGYGTSLIVQDGLVILPNDEQEGASALIALDAQTGETRWQVPRTSESGSYSTPCLYQPAQGDPVLIFHSQAHGISAIAPDSGKIVWELPGIFDKRSVSSPVIANGLIIGSCGSGGGGNYVVAVRPGDPATATKPELAYEVRRSAPYVPTSVCVGDWLYLWSDAGIVSRVHAATGEVQWQERADGRFFGSPVCVDGRLFCVSTTGEVVVLGTSEQFEVLARNPLGETTHSTPAIAGGRMYIHTAGHLISIGGRPTATADTL